MTSKKGRKAAPIQTQRKPRLAAPKTTTPESPALSAAKITGAVVLKVGAIGATEAASLTVAQALYVLARETSGAGASDFPAGAVYQDGTQVARVSYNGRAWDMNDQLVAECPSDSAIDSLRKLAGDENVSALAAAREATASDPAQNVESNGNGTVTVTQPEAEAEAAPAQQLEPATSVTVSAQLLAAALAIAPKVDKTRPQLAGIYLHQVDGDMRMVAVDGHRMLVMNLPAGDGKAHAAHAWGKDGVILPAEALQRIARYVGKEEGAAISISYGVGHPHAGVTEVGGMARFAVQPIGGQFPPYTRAVEQAAGAFTTQREPTETNAVASEYLKSAGVVAAALGAPHVFPFVGADGQCTVFTFATVPGAVLYIMPVRQNSTSASLQAETVKLIGAAGMAGTIAALKAHETRTRTSANNVRLSKEERTKLTDKADAYAKRIADIQAACTPALPAPVTGPETGATDEAETGEEDNA